jgi:hypothetical protein
MKFNSLGTKEYIKLKSLSGLKELTQQVNHYVGETALLPSLQNRYLRSYYIDRNQNFRLTVDRKLEYSFPDFEIHSMDHPPLKDDRIIVEIKFEKEHHDAFNSISDAFPFRLSKHSKYVTGLMGLVY